MNDITITREDNLRDVFSTGLQKSASSLSMMINAQVSVKDVEINISQVPEEEDYAYFSTLEESVVMLKTELVGPVIGVNYALFTSTEVNAIRDSAFDDELLDEDSAQFTIEFLKEIENVLAASTITELADSFKLNIFGDVPKIQAVSGSSVAEVISSETSTFKKHAYLRCKFHAPDLGISPEILWFFNGAFASTEKLSA